MADVDSGYNTPKNGQESEEDIPENRNRSTEIVSNRSQNMSAASKPRREGSFTSGNEQSRPQNRSINYQSSSTSSQSRQRMNTSALAGTSNPKSVNDKRPVTTQITKSESNKNSHNPGGRSNPKSSVSGGVSVGRPGRSGFHNRTASAPSKPKKDDSAHFDLIANPNMLLQQLGEIELNPEELDYLLNDAYALNKKLKEELQRQEAQATRPKSPKSSSKNSRQGSGKPAKLPPLSASMQRHERQSTIYSAPKTSASYSGTPIRGSGYGVKKHDSPPQKRSQSSKKVVHESQSKGGWDDRFSYS